MQKKSQCPICKASFTYDGLRSHFRNLIIEKKKIKKKMKKKNKVIIEKKVRAKKHDGFSQEDIVQMLSNLKKNPSKFQSIEPNQK